MPPLSSLVNKVTSAYKDCFMITCQQSDRQQRQQLINYVNSKSFSTFHGCDVLLSNTEAKGKHLPCHTGYLLTKSASTKINETIVKQTNKKKLKL